MSTVDEESEGKERRAHSYLFDYSGAERVFRMPIPTSKEYL